MWHRIVIVASGTRIFPVSTYYIDGVRVIGEVRKSRFDNYSSPLRDAIVLFSDIEGRTGNVFINSFAVFDFPLTKEEVSVLGRPSADGIPYLIATDQPRASAQERRENVHVRSMEKYYSIIANETSSGASLFIAISEDGTLGEWQRT